MAKTEKNQRPVTSKDIPVWVQYYFLSAVLVLLLIVIFYEEANGEKTNIPPTPDISSKRLQTLENNQHYQQLFTMVFNDSAWVQVLSPSNIKNKIAPTEFKVITDQQYQAGDTLSLSETEILAGEHGLIIVISDISAGQIYTSLQIEDKNDMAIVNEGQYGKKLSFVDKLQLIEASTIHLNSTALRILN